MRVKKASRLWGTSPTLDGIQDVIAAFYAGERKTLVLQEDGTWSVVGARGPITTVRVRLHAGRYRFEGMR